MDYTKIPSDRYEDVIFHLRKSFFCDEPLNKAVNLCCPNEGHRELENHSRLTLADDLSIMAITADNKIAGVALNGILRPGDLEKSTENLNVCSDPNFVKIFKLLYDENLQADLFNYFRVNKLFEIRILSVDSDYRGQGIAKQLLAKSEVVAKENKFILLKTDATGVYSQKIAQSFGFCTVKELIYSEYLDSRDKRIFVVEPPHDSLKIMCKTLDQEL